MDLKEIPNRDAVVDNADRIVSRPWNKWLTDLRTAVNKLIAGIFDGSVTIAGNLTVTGIATFLGQIIFPSGSWTVTIGGTGGQSGQVYALQAASYLKIGPLVFLSWRVQLSTLGTITGTVRIKGLPFASTAAASFRARYVVGWANMTTAFVNVQGSQNENIAEIDLVGAAAATTSFSTLLVQADLTNTTLLTGSGVYLAAT